MSWEILESRGAKDSLGSCKEHRRVLAREDLCWERRSVATASAFRATSCWMLALSLSAKLAQGQTPKL